MEQLNSHFIGEITEQQVALEFLKLGILISKPLVQSSRYDFIADINHKLYNEQARIYFVIYMAEMLRIFII